MTLPQDPPSLQRHPAKAARRFSAVGIVGFVLLILAAVVIAGWLTQNPAWVRHQTGTAMVLNTALCFGLMALALLTEPLAPAMQRRLQSALGIIVMLIAGSALAAHILGINLGTDWAALHRWHPDDNLHPGRMPIPTALGFVLCGAILILMYQVRRLWVGLLVQVLNFAVIFIGSLGGIGYLLKLFLVYENYVFAEMAPATAAGLVLTGIALWLHWERADWYRLRTLVANEARHISLNSALVLAGIVCASMLSSLVLMQREIESLAGNSLLWPLKSRVDLFKINIDLRSNRAAAVATRPEFVQLLRRLDDRPGDQETLSRLRDVTEGFLPMGFTGIAFHGSGGRELVKAGRFAEQPEIKLELHTPAHPSSLMWSRAHFVLQTSTPVLHDNAPVGMMVAEQRLTALTSALEYSDDFAATGEISVCARQKENLACFPQRYIPQAFTVPYSESLPMARALANETGISVIRDHRSRDAMAAYAPISTLGLGMMVKVDTAELYAPLRSKLYIVLILALILVAGGALLLYWRVTPLARKLYLEEQRLKLALECSNIAWWDLDIQTGQVHLSERWQSMLGMPAQAITTTLDELQSRVHPDDLPPLRRRLRAAIKSDLMRYDVEHRIQKPDGNWIWIYSIGKVVERDSEDRALRMIGINSDISQRKKAALRLEQQGQYDLVTGLPSRALFSDRLRQAVARARRNTELIAVLYLDIDRFKQVNDTYGQLTGDALVKSFAQRLEGCIRAIDTVARLNSDKFAVVLEDLETRDDGCRIAEKIVNTARSEFIIEHRAICITISAGIAFYYGEADVSDPELLLKTAESALYEAKNTGRDRYELAN